jgi:hypothetical protein
VFTAIASALESAGSKVDPFADSILETSGKFANFKDDVDDATGSVEEFEGVAGSTIDTLTFAQEAFNAAATASGNFASELDRLTGKMGGVVESEEAIWKWALELNSALEEQDEGFGHVNRSLAINTLEGQANRDLLEEQIQNIVALNGAYIENGVSVEDAAHTTRFNTEQLVANAVAAGFAESEVRELLRQYGLTPEMVETAIVQANMLTAQEDLAELLAKYDDIPPEVATEIQTLIDNGLYDHARARLNQLAAARLAPIKALATGLDAARRALDAIANARRVATIVTQIVNRGDKFAEGGYITKPLYGATVGEAGPEVILPLTDKARMASLLGIPQVAGPISAAMGGGSWMPMHGWSGGGGGGDTYVNATINMPPGSDGDDVVRALRQYERRRGPIPINVR